MSLAEYEPRLTEAVRSTLASAAPDATVDEVLREQRQCQTPQGRGRGVDQRSQGWLLTLPPSRPGPQFLVDVAEHWRSRGFTVDPSDLDRQQEIAGTTVYADADDGMRMSANLAEQLPSGQTYAAIGATSPCMDPSRSDIRDFDPDAPPPEPQDAQQP